MKQNIENRLNASLTLIGLILFSIREIYFSPSSLVSFLVKIIIVLGVLWLIIGRCFARLIYLITSDFIEPKKREELDRIRREKMVLEEKDTS